MTSESLVQGKGGAKQPAAVSNLRRVGHKYLPEDPWPNSLGDIAYVSTVQVTIADFNSQTMGTGMNHICMDGDDCEVVDPKASNMVEALRDIGYSLESAVADIIDNAISASARRIDIRFGWTSDGTPWLLVKDDGHGMLDAELVEAMRPGGRDPLGHRTKDDLGRFGLGLKTASFSQCRKLTVVTRKEGLLSSRQWDLDLVRREDRWVLRRPSKQELSSMPCVGELGECGTLVLWENLDRLDFGSDLSRHHQIMNDRVMTISEHVSLVFHRFMAGEPGHQKVVIAINNEPLIPFDPFNAKHPATIHLGEEPLEIEGQEVILKPYILPHHSKVGTDEYERLGGREGYLRGQGFYIYRNRRLIIHSTWFRMARQDEMTKLARVQVDIPNTLDHLWTIDVRKSRAQPPETVKRRLRGILDRIRDTSKRPYTHRGSCSLSPPGGEPVWRRLNQNDRVSYAPNNEHALLAEFRADLPESLRGRFDGLLAVLGASLPFAMLFNDMAARPKETDGNRETHGALDQLASLLFGEASDMDLTTLETILRATEPFASSPEFVKNYIARLGRIGGTA